MKRLWLVAACALPLAGQKTEMPRHLFAAEPLTAPNARPAREIAAEYLRGLAPRYGLTPDDLAGAYVVKEYGTAHNGVRHLVFRQRFQDLDVANAEFTVNVDGDGRVINAGGDLVRPPAAGVTAPDPASALAAVRAAAREVNPLLAERYVPFQTGQSARAMRFNRGAFPRDIEGRPGWYAVNGAPRPAWQFEVTDADGVSAWSVVVDASSRKVLAKRSLTLRQAPRGLIFPDSPQPNPTPGVLLAAPPPLVNRTAVSFAGDPAASPRGWIAAAETAGNNVVAGGNALGIDCLTALTCLVPPLTTAAANRDFSFPLQLGDGAPPVTQFADASAANLFYWVNRAHDIFYLLGFDEAAGNFQQDNFGRGGTPGDPIYAYNQYGAAAPSLINPNQAFFSQFRDEDGSQATMAIGLEMAADGLLRDLAFDAPTIVHEYAHGVSTRLVRQLNATFQGQAMGEGWSDFFALEVLTPDGAPPDGAYPMSEYPDQTFGAGIRTHPYSTSLDLNPLTYALLGRVDPTFGPEVHADGEIWTEALWETRAALIRQFGEKEGRRRVRLLVIDGMKMAPPAPSMVDMRDAILLADRVDFKGASQDQIWAAFARRGLGALAQSSKGALHVSASFDKPSTTGTLKFYEDRYVIGEDVRVALEDSNLDAPSVQIQLTGSSGDLENLLLRRQGSIYVGTIFSTYAPVAKGDGTLQLIPGDFISAYYHDANTASGPRLAQVTVPTVPDYSEQLRAASFGFARERALSLHGVSSKLVELPFRFRFFGKDYAYLRVYQNGLLTFDLPDYSPCSDAFSLQMINAIAPLWMSSTTDGVAQRGEDVYMSQGPDWVTFRWAAETAFDFPGSRPEALNFAATLYQDGRIQFQYGSGNRNLASGSQLQGCPAGSPTVGISNGHEAFAEIAATHDSKGTLENAATVILDPPYNFSTLPQGQLESPADGDHVQGVLAGKGILYDTDPEGGLRRVDLLIDGIAQDVVDVGLARPDFCDQQKVPGCPLVGYSFAESLDLLGIRTGAHTLQLRATNTRGGFTDFPDKPLTFQSDAGQASAPYGKIEAPADGAEVSGRVPVRGYVAADNLRILAVDVLVDGVTFGRARYGDTRNDICGGLDPRPPDCPRIGFSFTLNTVSGPVALPNGSHTLALRVIDEAVRLTRLSPITVMVNNPAAPAPPQAVLSTPRANDRLSDTVHVSGYAWAPAGKIRAVQLVIDGIIAVNIPYGQPRPEACAQLPDVAACPDIGFETDYDTTKLSNGPHYLLVLVQDDNGVVTVVPANSFYGMNVVVQNPAPQP